MKKTQIYEDAKEVQFLHTSLLAKTDGFIFLSAMLELNTYTTRPLKTIYISSKRQGYRFHHMINISQRRNNPR